MGEFYPPASIAKKPEVVVQIKEAIDIEREKKEEVLRNLEKLVPEIEMWKELDQAAREAVINFYKNKVEIDIDPKTQPKAFFIPSDKMGEAGFDSIEAVASVKYNLIACGVLPGNDLQNYPRLVMPFHERFHFTGSTAVTASAEEVKGFFPWQKDVLYDFDTAQDGFITSGKETRGECLEEAVTAFYTEELLATSTDLRIVNVRKKMLLRIINKNGVSEDVKKYEEKVNSMNPQEFNKHEAEVKSHITGTDRTVKGMRLYKTLLDRADRLDLKPEFEKLALTTRINPEKTKRFFDLLSQVAGSKEIAREIYKASSWDFSKIDEITNKLSG